MKSGYLSADVHQLPVGHGAVGHQAPDGRAEEGQEGGAGAISHRTPPRPLGPRPHVDTPCRRQTHQAHQDPNVGQSQSLQPARLTTASTRGAGQREDRVSSH